MNDSNYTSENILDYETVALDDEDKALVIIDQTKLPNETVILRLKTAKEYYDAIYLLQVRGAPAIGVAAGYAIYLESCRIADEMINENSREGRSSADDAYRAAGGFDRFYSEFVKAKEYLNSSRPTAVNLSWALNRMECVAAANRDLPIDQLLNVLRNESVTIQREDISMCLAIGENALTLVKKGDGLLTHCNAGQLATSKYGTATAVMYLGHDRGYDFHIYCDETRPLLQGARLTAYELSSAGLDVTLLCDNMVASAMSKGMINAVFVGADRIAANGDTANKIGTSVVATVAKHYGIPFYVCAPSSTVDASLKSGADIPIEMRKSEEVTEMWYAKRMAPEGIKAYNPAFDVTDHSLITAIITEKGVAYPPYKFE